MISEYICTPLKTSEFLKLIKNSDKALAIPFISNILNNIETINLKGYAINWDDSEEQILFHIDKDYLIKINSATNVFIYIGEYSTHKLNKDEEFKKNQRLDIIHKPICNNNGVTFYNNGSIRFVGTFFNDAQHKGVEYYFNSTIIKNGGEFDSNNCLINGTKYFINGNKEDEGTFLNNELHGEGCKYYTCGDTFEIGNFENGKLNGEGIRYYLNMKVNVKGNFKNGLLNGYCTEYYNEFNKFNCTQLLKSVGEFINNKPTGDCIIYSSEIDENTGHQLIEAEYKKINNKYLYYNIHKKLNPERYKNILNYYTEYYCFIDPKTNKQVIKFDGIRNDKFEGLCKEYYPTGILKSECYYRNGKKDTDYGIYYYESGNIMYEGGYHENMKNQNGIEYYDKQLVKYEGGFLNDLYDGTGTLYDESGNKLYSGEFKKGVYHNNGIEYYPCFNPISGEQLIYQCGFWSNGSIKETIIYSTKIDDEGKQKLLKVNGLNK